MYFYVLQLFDTDYKEDINLAMISSGIKQATVVEGMNLDNVLQKDFPLFAGFFTGTDRERYSLMVFGIVEERETMISFLEILQQAGIDNNREEIFKLVILPAEKLAG
jgi:hypothetical protein